MVPARFRVLLDANVLFPLTDFHTLPEGVEAQSPDDFLCNLMDLDPPGLLRLVRERARDLRRPPRTFEDVVRILGKVAPSFVQGLVRLAESP